MARSRNIKPSIMDNEELAALPALTRLLFIYMWMLADREGRLEDRPGRIKKQALGYDDGSADEMLNELAKAGFVERYESKESKVIQILAFHKHQTPHVREAASELPCKEESTTKVVRGPEMEVPSTKRGESEASPRSPDSGFLIPDTPFPIPERGESADAPPPAKQAKASAVKKPEDIDGQVWSDWLALRKAKKAPVTETVLSAAISEAEKANLTTEDFLRIWCLRGSQGLQAEWIKPEERKQATRQPPKSFAERDAAAGRKRWEQMTGRRHPDSAPDAAGDFIDAPGNILEIES